MGKVVGEIVSRDRRTKLRLASIEEGYVIDIVDGRQIKRRIRFDKDSYQDLFGSVVENMVKEGSESLEIENKEKILHYVLEKFEHKQLRKRINSKRYRGDFELTSEEVLQLIYEVFGEKEFVSREFKQVYKSRYGRQDSDVWLYRLRNRGRLNCRNADLEDERIEKVYCLSRESLREVRRFGSFTSSSHPRYSRKRG